MLWCNIISASPSSCSHTYLPQSPHSWKKCPVNPASIKYPADAVKAAFRNTKLHRIDKNAAIMLSAAARMSTAVSNCSRPGVASASGSRPLRPAALAALVACSQ